MHDDIQGTSFWPDIYDGRALIGDSYRDHLAGLPMEENIKKYNDAKLAGELNRMVTWAYVLRPFSFIFFNCFF